MAKKKETAAKNDDVKTSKAAKEGAPKAEATKAEAAPKAAKAPAKKPAGKAAKAEAPAGDGMLAIDANLAASAAAKMLVARPSENKTAVDPKGQSSAFKNMKEQLNKPKSGGLGNLFGLSGGGKKAGSHFTSNQKGHNQTFGGMNKTGVPRRTNG